MKKLLLSTFLVYTLIASADEKAVIIKKNTKSKSLVIDKKIKNKNEKKIEAPCDKKEDILKKLEEKRKAQAESGKGFNLQGGDTGCSVK